MNYQPGQFPKICTCCREEIGSEAEWRRLELCGAMDDGVCVLELRNHECGSTISVETTEESGKDVA